MKNNKLFKAVKEPIPGIHVSIKMGSSKRWNIQSQKTKYVNGKLSEVIEVGYTASIDTPDYVLEEDKSNNGIQITARNDNTSGICLLTQKESDNQIYMHITTPEEKEYWEIRFAPELLTGFNMDMFFVVGTNIIGEGGLMAEGDSKKNWIVNQDRNLINVYISPRSMYLIGFDVLSWSCLDKDGNAFNPNYSLPNNSDFKTKTTGLGSYTLVKASNPSSSSPTTPILTSRFNPTKKYPLDLDFYWGVPTTENP